MSQDKQSKLVRIAESHGEFLSVSEPSDAELRASEIETHFKNAQKLFAHLFPPNNKEEERRILDIRNSLKTLERQMEGLHTSTISVLHNSLLENGEDWREQSKLEIGENGQGVAIHKTGPFLHWLNQVREMNSAFEIPLNEAADNFDPRKTRVPEIKALAAMDAAIKTARLHVGKGNNSRRLPEQLSDDPALNRYLGDVTECLLEGSPTMQNVYKKWRIHSPGRSSLLDDFND